MIKPKLFDLPNSEIGRSVKRVNENLWFKQQQRLLLWIANSQEGRALLCIDKDFPPIVEISKKHIKGFIGFNKNKPQYISGFKVGAKYANVIRYRWKEFQEMALWYYINEMSSSLIKKQIFNPVCPIPGYAYLVNTSRPDPDPETTTVDGGVSAQIVQTTWASIRGDAGNNAVPSAADINIFNSVGGTTSNNWSTLRRAIYLFDTSGIGGTSTIDSATLDIEGTGKNDPDTNTPDINIYTSNPASNTNLVGTDYSTVGTVAQATAITFANWSVTADNTFTLNSTGLGNISKTGVTKFGAANANYDVANVAPTWSNGGSSWINGFAADQTGTASDPTLTTQYTAASTTATSKIMLMGLGS